MPAQLAQPLQVSWVECFAALGNQHLHLELKAESLLKECTALVSVCTIHADIYVRAPPAAIALTLTHTLLGSDQLHMQACTVSWETRSKFLLPMHPGLRIPALSPCPCPQASELPGVMALALCHLDKVRQGVADLPSELVGLIHCRE